MIIFKGMNKLVILFLFIYAVAGAQTKSPASKKNPKAKKDTVVAVVETDTIDHKDEEIREQHQFAVYSKRPRGVDKKMKLCLNLVGENDAEINYCVNDSLCKDPEFYKVLFNQADGDTTYMLIFVDAFSKVRDRPACDAGRETKLFFTRWNTKTNKAIWKQRTISSCLKAITNMTKAPIRDWDGNAPLVVNYHRGGTNFIELRFDPGQYKLGLQSANDAETKGSQ
jgi:hypothetical protein